MDFRFGLVVSLCLLGLVNGVPLKFRDCGSPSGHPLSVVVEDCDNIPCTLKRGQSYSINVTFGSFVDSQTSKAVVHGIIAGVPVPYAIDNDNGCDSGISCPIKTKQQYSYVTRLPVKQVYPSIFLLVKWELHDEHNKDLFCIEFPVHIQ